MAILCSFLGLHILLALSNVLVSALPTISALGIHFFTSDGDQFFIKGVAYQLIADDPLINTTQCRLDATLMKDLGANSIRVYHVDPESDHAGCMREFALVGIYIWLDLDSFSTYIKLEVASWTQEKFDFFRAVMDEFQRYDNTAGFFVGNEVLNRIDDSPAAPYLLAAKKDLQAYGEAQSYRPIPIGYSATDTAVLRPVLQDYLTCRPEAAERLDFFALNSYEWCGQTSYEVSGYKALHESFEDYPIPWYFSETGCITVPPRDFADMAAIFGPNMTDTCSGAMAYEWIEEANDYGLCSYGPFQEGAEDGSRVAGGFTRQGTPTPVQPDFMNLKSQWAAATPSSIALSAYAPPPVTPRPCPEYTEGGWAVSPSAPLPTLGAQAAAKAPIKSNSISNDASSTQTEPSLSTQNLESQTEESAGSAQTKPTQPEQSNISANNDEAGSVSSIPASDDAIHLYPTLAILADGSTSGSILALLTLGVAAMLLL